MKVLLVFFDTLRYDHVSFNGYFQKTTPVLDELAQEATVFKNCYATDVPTQPCYTATFSGQRGITTGVVSHGQSEDIIPHSLDVFPAILSKNGVTTVAISTLCRFRRWFAEGFMNYIQPNVNKWLQHVTCEDVNKEALKWLQNNSDGDFFMFLHYWDPHSPYNLVPNKYVEKFYDGDPYNPANNSLSDLRSRPLMNFFISGGAVPELRRGLTDAQYIIAQYDAEIRYADEHFGQILELLRTKRVLDDVTIIFTADHGEALDGEHGVYFDHMDAYEQTAHVPLFVWSPERAKAQIVDSFVQHTDLAPTILDLFGIESPSCYEGSSLCQMLQGNAQKSRAFVVTNQGLWSAQRSYRTEQWTLVRTYERGMVLDAKDWELYDKLRDAKETVDISKDHIETINDLKGQLLEWVDQHVGNKPDPLRIAAMKNDATNLIKKRFKEWVRSSKAEERTLSPKDRGAIDYDPKSGKA